MVPFSLLGVSLCLIAGLLDKAMGAEETKRKLDRTPTWAVAGVCAVIIIISLVLEKFLHKVGIWLTDRHKVALFESLEKVKAELMIVGFISLILAFGQGYIAEICIPRSVADTMLPCSVGKKESTPGHRRLLWYERRSLAADCDQKCKPGYEPLISVDGLHQLHILIFFLAAFHVIYSLITMVLGRLKIRGWKHWEAETSTRYYEYSNDPSRFRFTHQISFVRAHTSFWARIPFFFYVGCFFRQFFRSVSKDDYLTLRNGFVTVHLGAGSKFNFQKYIKRSLEDDFKVVVGVSPLLWASFVIFLLLNVEGMQALFWASLIPLIIILLVGTELESILTKMASEIAERHAVVQGIPLVQGSDKYFWFGRPQLILNLIHFVLFQNAFQFVYFFWIWHSFGLKSCFHANFKLAIAKVIIGVGVQCLCSYITLPLYALVTQMGSHMKKSVFDEQTSKALKKWHMAVKKKTHGGKSLTLGGQSSTISTEHSSTTGGSTLQRFKTTGHSTHSAAFEDHETSDPQTDTRSRSSTTHSVVRVDQIDQQTEINERHDGEQTSRD